MHTIKLTTTAICPNGRTFRLIKVFPLYSGKVGVSKLFTDQVEQLGCVSSLTSSVRHDNLMSYHNVRSAHIVAPYLQWL